MKIRNLYYLSLIIGLISGCASMFYVSNPKYHDCNRSCSATQNSCMMNASTSEEIDKCKETLNICIAQCDNKFPKTVPRDELE